jgi:hypothetical protein
MKNITFHHTFTPHGEETTRIIMVGKVTLLTINSNVLPALTLHAGVQWREAYIAAVANNRTIVGGLSADGSIGSSGGWVSGGGHSALSPNYGLGKSVQGMLNSY